MYYYDRAFILKQEEEHSTGKQERLQFFHSMPTFQ